MSASPQIRNIPFNRPFLTGDEPHLIAQALDDRRSSGAGPLGRACEDLLRSQFGGARCLLTTSCTHALELIALLLEIGPGDEVVLPSFTFVSTANAFVLRGAHLRFVDVEYPSLNTSAAQFAAAITPRTRALVAVNYGGGGADMEALGALARERNVVLVEDAAQSLHATFRGRPYGTFGALGAVSFHETKNAQCGEGGALVINDGSFFERAEILREKGTNRSRFLRGEVDKYTWVDAGSSYVQSDILAAVLLAQLRHSEEITRRRLAIWRTYAEAFTSAGIPFVKFGLGVAHNGHLFGVFAPSASARNEIIARLKLEGVQATFHYVPLHSSPFGERRATFAGKDRHTTDASSRLIRLPLYPDLTAEDVAYVIDAVARVFRGAR
jgi:dTDP-4-amino-4,6-dideoxygalactose transaminase